jgi:hypothetical protein
MHFSNLPSNQPDSLPNNLDLKKLCYDYFKNLDAQDEGTRSSHNYQTLRLIAENKIRTIVGLPIVREH